MNAGASRLRLRRTESCILALQKEVEEANQLNAMYKKRLEDTQAKYWKVALELHLSKLQSEKLQQVTWSATAGEHGSGNVGGEAEIEQDLQRERGG